MKGQACSPCAKRKVKCDRAEPSCSNCRRRRVDHCVYPEVSPHERIRELEVTVKALENAASLKRSRSPSQTSLQDSSDKNAAATPVLLQEGDQSVYLEWRGWQAWVSTARLHGYTKPGESSIHRSAHSSGKQLPHAFDGSLWPKVLVPMSQCPAPARDTCKLWDAFMQRVEPTIKISFGWTLRRLEIALNEPEAWQQLSLGEQALAVSACLLGAVSLSDEDCIQHFNRDRASLLLEYRTYTESLLTQLDLLAIDDISVLKAFCLYIKACVEIVTTRSLWSLMGLVTRSAEQLGVHRDGELLGLSVVETEERRRLWWQLQHIDLILAIKSGVTPMTMSADWDAKLPLNIEDSDIISASKVPPRERLGLTSLGYTLFSSWVIDQQRKFRQKPHEQRSLADRSILGPVANEMIDGLESGLNSKFLQYCDPINPLHMLLQVSARGLICILKLRLLHDKRLNSGHWEDNLREEYFDTCLQSLKYVINAFSQPCLRPFRWLSEASFTWHAFVGVLVELPQIKDSSKMKAVWVLITELYSLCPFLYELGEDKRRALAASSVVATWNACQGKPSMEAMEKPDFLVRLEEAVSELKASDSNGGSNSNDDGGGDGTTASSTRAADVIPASKRTKIQQPKEAVQMLGQGSGGEAGEPFDFNFDDIDWSFWDSIS